MKVPLPFLWQQNNEQLIITFPEKYFIFCWHASTSAGNFPPINKKQLNVSIRKDRMEIQMYQFNVTAFEGVFEQLILVDESEWDYIEQVGIRVCIQKRIQDKQWSQPFSSYEKEMYYKNYLYNTQVEFQSINLEFPMIAQDQIFKFRREEIQNQFEDSFQALKCAGYTTDFYVKRYYQFKDKISQQNKNLKDPVFLHTNVIQSDVIQKNQVLEHLNYGKLKPLFLSDLEFGINEGKYIIVKAIVDSLITVSNQLVVEDPYKNANRLFIYEFFDYKIKKGTWILIKDPFLKFGARDHLPLFRVEKPSEIILFADSLLLEQKPLQFHDQITSIQAERIQKVGDSQFKCIIFTFDFKLLSFTVMTFNRKGQNFISGQPVFYIQQDKDIWIPGDIQKQQMINGENCYEFQLKNCHQSQLALECLKSKIEKAPGEAVTFWKEQVIKVKDIFEYILFINKVPLHLLDSFVSLWNSQNIKSKYIIFDLFDFFKRENEAIISNNLSKKKQKQMKAEWTDANSMEINREVDHQIEDIISAYKIYQSEKKLNQTKVQGKDYQKENLKVIEKSCLLNDTQLKQKQQASLMSKSHLLDYHRVIDNLIKETDDDILQNALFYLTTFADQINASDQDNLISYKQFANKVISDKISSIPFKIDIVLKSLNLISFDYDHSVVEKMQRKQEKKKLKKKQRKTQKKKEQIMESLVNIPDEEIKFIEDQEEINNLTSQFIQDNQQNLSDDEYDNDDDDDNQDDINERMEDLNGLNFDGFQNQSNHNYTLSNSKITDQEIEGVINHNFDNKSIKSLITVHSKNQGQKKNDHWKDRLLERFDLDTSKQQVKEEILHHLKLLLKQEGSHIIQSKIDQNRFLIKDHKSKISYILRKSEEKSNGKIVYVPITILTNKMQFK